MKSLKYAIVSAILALGIAAPVVSAQDDAAPAKAKHSGGSHDMTASWLKGITLTADQQKQIDAIKADAKTKGPAGYKDAKAKIRAVLTADQQATFDTNTAAKGKGGDKSGDKGAGKKGKKSKGGSESGGGGDE